MIRFTRMEYAGLLPTFLSERDPRPAKEQLHTAYAHGGGWRPFRGFRFHQLHPGSAQLLYPGDPPMREISRAKLRNETIILFQADWVAIVQSDGSFEVARMD